MEKALSKVEAINPEAIMSGFKSALSNETIAASLRKAESEKTMMFVFHSWAEVNTRGVGKNYNDMKYWSLPRMELIPIYAWPIPVIHQGRKGFSMIIGPAGATMGSSDTVVTQRSQLAGETERYIRRQFGDKGVLPLDSLTCEEDAEKLEAFLLFDAVMTSRRPFNEQGDLSTPGVEVRMQDLPRFLAAEGPLLLDHAITHGVDLRAHGILRPGVIAGHYPLPSTSRAKGLKMLAEMQSNAELAVKAGRAVLTETRGQIQNAGKQISDSKARLDDLDEFLVEEIYDFSMDTSVERAMRANQPVVESIQESGRSNAVLTSTLQATLEELKALRLEVNEMKSKKKEAA